MAGKLLPSINLELFAWAVCFAITDHALFSREMVCNGATNDPAEKQSYELINRL